MEEKKVAERSLVLVPGLLCTRALFAAQIAELEGDVSISVGSDTRHATMAGIAEAILSDAPDRFALAGLSMGGYIAFEILRQAPERVERLALLDTNARADRPEQSAQRRDLVSLATKNGLGAVQDILTPLLIHESRVGDTALVATLRQMADDVGVEGFGRQQEAIITRADNRAFLHQITCPTLIVVGAQDQLTPPKVAAEMADGISAAELEIVPECGHLSTLERPDVVTELMKKWLGLL